MSHATPESLAARARTRFYGLAPIREIRSWLRDSGFWRDVASRTLSGLIIATIGYIAAVTLGYLSSPSAAEVRRTLGFLGLLAAMFIAAWFFERWRRKLPRWPRLGVAVAALWAIFAWSASNISVSH
ncbi:hypothetical protein [Cellulomonas sp. RIT-PI-Y]|uniref:hypothetical protein n=1 Tax=Cellulomonas sp. RIT-PI-Y TaxID=3035297 RepID=UPI0021D931CE|nr:hypothetical protein [Cellulomonas sp. RIT-PI-Y]